MPGRRPADAGKIDPGASFAFAGFVVRLVPGWETGPAVVKDVGINGISFAA